MRIRFVFFALAFVLTCAGGVWGQPVPPSPRLLPPPVRYVQPMTPMPLGGVNLFVMPTANGVPPMLSPLPPGYRPNPYDVWQYYGVTYNGWLRPRVIQGNGSSGFYLSNGYPFPTNVHPGRKWSQRVGNVANGIMAAP